MVTLILDTAGAQCAAALTGPDGSLPTVRSANMVRGHAEALLPMIDDLLNAAGCTYDRLGRIVVTRGPGAFTGVRVGISVARGLALATGIPVLGLSSLQALAAQSGAGCETSIHVIIAGRGETVFYQAFVATSGGGLPTPVGEPINPTLNEARGLITAKPGIAVGLNAVHELTPARLDLALLAAHLPVDMTEAAFPAVPLYVRAADAAPGAASLPRRA